jgi:hypothetical protein
MKETKMKTTLQALAAGIVTMLAAATFSTTASAAPWQGEHARAVQVQQYQVKRVAHRGHARFSHRHARHHHRHAHGRHFHRSTYR